MSPPPTLQSSERIRLGTHVDLILDGDTLALRSPTTEVLVNGPGNLLAAIAASKQISSIADLADRHQVAPNHLLGCLAQIDEAGMLLRASAEREATDMEAYLLLLHGNCEVLAAEALQGPLWPELIAGNAPTTEILGWGVEFFHFINGSNEYMPLAVAQTRIPTPLRLEMARHCVEESDHGTIFLTGLSNCGLPQDAVVSSVPLPTTFALLNLLAELACEDTLAYLSTFAVMQQQRMRPQSHEFEHFKDHLCAAYPHVSPLFEALHTHSLIDEELEHDELVFDTVVKATGLPTHAQRRMIADTTRRFSWAFSEFFNGIHRAYSSGTGVVPRRPLAVVQFQ